MNTVEFDVEIGNEKILMQYTFFYDNSKVNTAFVKENLSSTRKWKKGALAFWMALLKLVGRWQTEMVDLYYY